MSLPLVSIALCTYNGARYLEEQVISIVNQTYTNLELVVVDDCSSDNTYILLQELATRYPIIRCFQNDHNIGFNANFEKAISLTTGNFIAISDQDDVWEPNKIDTLIRHIGDNWLIFSNSSYINKDGGFMEGQLLYNFEFQGRNFKSLLLYNFVTGHTSLFTRSFKQHILPIPSKGYYDWWMGFIALYHHKLAYIDQKLTKHRIHPESVMSKNDELTDDKENQQFKEISTNLSLLKNYENLGTDDQKWISALYTAYLDRKGKSFNYRLITKVFSTYTSLFPDSKKRGMLSKLNFAFKFARPLK